MNQVQNNNKHRSKHVTIFLILRERIIIMESNQTYIQRTSGLKSKDYIGYAMIDTAGCLLFALVTTLLQKFYTDIFHLSPMFIMIMFIVARVWDGINDPIMGRICDTVEPGPKGRYRKWILYAAGPLALSAVLMFLKLPGIGEDGNYVMTCVYATVTYILFGMAYTVLQIPYGSLASVVTTDAHERSKLSVFRSIGAALGSIPVLVIASFAYAKRLDEAGNVVIGENGKAITDMQYKPVILGVCIMAVVSFIMLMIAYRLNTERVKTKPQEKKKGRPPRSSRRYSITALSSRLRWYRCCFWPDRCSPKASIRICSMTISMPTG